MSIPFLKIFLTPLLYEGVYGEAVDVTKDLDITEFIHENIGSIKREIDSGDYDFGVFVFGAITLNCFNHDGRFSHPHDWRSLFRYKRDLAKVSVVFTNTKGEEQIIFSGLINEDATRDDDLPESNFKDATIRFKVLSEDSIFRHVPVAGGAVGAGVLFSTAIKQILNTAAITAVLNFDPDNIKVAMDLTIDDGEYFSGMSVKEALDELLVASHSVLYIDQNKNIIVSDRTERGALYPLYGENDPLGRGNILEISGYNSGLQRAFSAVEINDTERVRSAFVNEYGYRKKSITFDFVSDITKCEAIAEMMLDGFSVPRFECTVQVAMDDVMGIDLLERVSIDHPYRFTPADGQDFIPTLDTAVIGQTVFPRVSGVLNILPNIIWKVIGIEYRLKDFTAKLKLRQIGTVIGQGYI